MLLVFIMVFTMLPLQVFGYTDVNNQTGITDIVSNTSTVSGWATNGDNLWGLRFCLYFAEGIRSESEINSSTQFNSLGERIYVRMAVNQWDLDYISSYDIYDRTHNEDGKTKAKLVAPERAQMRLYEKSEMPVMQKFPSDFFSPNRSVTVETLNKFFAGLATKEDISTVDPKFLNFENTVAIANKILEGSGYQELTDDNWKKG